MSNALHIPFLNPVQFVEEGKELLPQYNTKFFDDFVEKDTWKAWRRGREYASKWQTSDTIHLQVISNVSPLSLKLYDAASGRLVSTTAFAQIVQNQYQPELWVYEVSLSLSTLPRGYYQLKIDVAGLSTLVSEYLHIEEQHPNTVLIEYLNQKYYGDVLFETEFNPNIRVEGWFKMKPPVSKDTTYEDQVLNQRMLLSEPYRVWDFIIGPSSGIPDWMADKLIWILGCDEIYLDGKAFTKADGAKFEEAAQEGYANRGYVVEMRETVRRASKVIGVDADTNKRLFVTMNVETAGFADTSDPAGSIATILEVE